MHDNTETMSVNEDSPSAKRRKALKEADSASEIRILESCPLSKYVDVAERILERFQDAVDGRRLDEAYIFGLRFANLSLSGLPQHPEWRRDTSSKARKRLTSQVADVLCMMDVIKQRMDAEELMKIKAEMIAKQEEDRRKKEEEDRRKHELDEAQRREQQKRDALEQERARFLAEQRSRRKIEMEQNQATEEESEKVVEKKKDKVNKKKEIEQSAMAKLKALQAKPAAPEDSSTVVTKKSEKKPKNDKKVEQTKRRWFHGGKTKSTKITNEAKTPSPLPSGTKDVAKKTALVAALANRNVAVSKDVTDASSQLSYGKTTARKNIETTFDENENNTIQSSDSHTVESEKSSVSPSSVRSKKNTQTVTPTMSEVLASFTAVQPNKRSDLAITNQNTANEKEQFSVKPDEKSSEQCTQNASRDQPTAIPPSVRSLSNADRSIKIDANSTTNTIISAQMTPMSRKEKATIDKLQLAITVQEDRLEEIETKHIPHLLQSAKAFLTEKKKEAALKCLVHKKRLERQLDAIKAAIFNMETQMFMLESAFEDRHVQKALDEAAAAIAGYQRNIGDPKAVMVDLTNMSASLPDLEVGDATDEELMEELTEWLSPEERKEAAANKNAYTHDDDISMLTVPTFLPAATASSKLVDRVPVAEPGS